MAECNDVKICASNRPWNVFQAAFGGNKEQVFALRDLTQDNTPDYVRGTLSSNEGFAHMLQYDYDCIKIIHEVTTKA